MEGTSFNPTRERHTNPNGRWSGHAGGTSRTDLFNRSVVAADIHRSATFVAGRRVLITGAAGSIGRELARQVACLGPAIIYALDINESGLVAPAKSPRSASPSDRSCETSETEATC